MGLIIINIVLIIVLIADIICTIKLSKDYKVNTKVCKYLLECWEKNKNE